MKHKTFREYSLAARSTRLSTASEAYVLMGLVGEVGELYSKLSKSVRDGTDFPEEDLLQELGDILWFVSSIADDLGSNLTDVASMNIKKLQDRKKRGTLKGSGDNR